jgi:hypothetical protein
MQSPSVTPEIHSSSSAPPLEPAAHCSSIRDAVLFGLMLVTLIRTSEALAGEQAPTANAPLDPKFGDFRQLPTPAATSSPSFLYAPPSSDKPPFSATDFRPRKHSLLESEPATNSLGDAPMLRSTTVWQRLSEYRSHDRVRVLTLWESTGSTISLQAGKHGDPSLQWTSRLMNRGGATQGLLDRFFSVSLGHAASGMRSARSTSAAQPPKLAGVAVKPDLK